ncbi:MAG: BrnA antitoxin family protein [Stigonema ocellatum SAG 48.90 = DSM 106950]|nr:BrnA antitoxin family protein [Stigonema ocellatum SAG 48.90 = DSM 106950]
MAISREEQLKILGSIKESDIDYSDAPRTDEAFWEGAAFNVPVPKVPVNMRLDADVVAWFKSKQARGYQTLMNFVLREYMLKHQKEPLPRE